jgi:hypothetical protein
VTPRRSQPHAAPRSLEKKLADSVAPLALVFFLLSLAASSSLSSSLPFSRYNRLWRGSVPLILLWPARTKTPTKEDDGVLELISHCLVNFNVKVINWPIEVPLEEGGTLLIKQRPRIWGVGGRRSLLLYASRYAAVVRSINASFQCRDCIQIELHMLYGWCSSVGNAHERFLNLFNSTSELPLSVRTCASMIILPLDGLMTDASGDAARSNCIYSII